jgi:DNA repair photolyase
VGIVTKGPMIVRDKDVLAQLSGVAKCSVCMSVPTVDEDAWRMLEPGTAHPLQRLRAVRQLVDAGVSAGVLMAPIVPAFSSARHKVEATIKAIADHGARFVGCNVMYLQDGTRSHFMNFIAQEFPAMKPRFDRLYAKKYPPESYVKEVKGMVRVLQQRYGLARREDAGTEPTPVPAPADPEQVGFAW